MRCQVAHAAMTVERSITRAWVTPTEPLHRSKEATMRMVRTTGGRLELQESWAFLKAACAIGSCLLPIAARVGQHGLEPMSVGRIIGIASGSVFLLVGQSIGTKHPASHIDYSQVCVIVAGWCEITLPDTSVPVWKRTLDVYRDRALCRLVTHDDKPLRVTSYLTYVP